LVDRIVKAAIVVIAAGVILAIVLWLKGESRRKMPPVLRDLSETVTDEFAEKLPRDRSVNDLLILVLQSGNRDEEVEFKQLLKEKVKGTSKYKISDWDDVKKTFSDNYWQLAAQKLGMLPGEDPKDLKQAKKALDFLATTGKKLDGVLLVTVDDFDEGQEGFKAKVSCEGEIYSVDQQKTIDTVPQITDSVSSHWDYRYLHHKISSTSVIGRFLLWFLIASTLPFLLIQLVRAVVSKRNNELNVALVAGLTLVDVLLGWVLLTSISLGMGTALIVLILLGAMGYYNYDACDYIERRLT
jgi:hypothetical protein